jgi:hypothetical protein
VAKRRQADASDLVKTLRGDLDWITMKALEKDRTRRYGSPAEFAADVRRYLDYEPVSAGPPSAGYRVRKFIRRHRLPVSAAAVVTLALLGGIVGTTFQWVRARRAEADAVAQRTRAEARFDDVRKLAGAFMFDVDETLQTAGPTKARQKLVSTSIEYLDRLAAEAADDPKLLADLCRGYMRVGRVQYYPGIANLGDRHGAMRSFQRALEIAKRREKLDPASIDVRGDLAALWDCMAEAQYGVEDLATSLNSLETARGMYERLAAEYPDAQSWSRNLALTLSKLGDTHRQMRQYDRALEYLEQGQMLRSQSLARHPDSALVRRDLATGYAAIGQVHRDRGFNDKGAGAVREVCCGVSRAAGVGAGQPDLPARRLAHARPDHQRPPSARSHGGGGGGGERVCRDPPARRRG